MNEVEKMYRNAGVKKQKYFSHVSFYDGSDVFEEKIPPFTTEKQLKLIKWIIIEGYIEDMLTVQISEENFEVCLADTFNELWQDLTIEEKHQIKEILNG